MSSSVAYKCPGSIWWAKGFHSFAAGVVAFAMCSLFSLIPLPLCFSSSVFHVISVCSCCHGLVEVEMVFVQSGNNGILSSEWFQYITIMHNTCSKAPLFTKCNDHSWRTSFVAAFGFTIKLRFDLSHSIANESEIQAQESRQLAWHATHIAAVLKSYGNDILRERYLRQGPWRNASSSVEGNNRLLRFRIKDTHRFFIYDPWALCITAVNSLFLGHFI